MAGYQYRPELKPPKPLGGIDFGNPALAPMVRMMTQNLRQAVRVWTAPEGVSVRTVHALVQNGEPVECFLVEPETDTSLPGLLYCHGGGFFLPLQVSSLQIAAFYAEKLQTRVFLPEYRILPDFPNPYPFHDCRSAWEEIAGQTEAYRLDGRLLLYGESAGGALAAGLAQWLRDRGESPPTGQLLIYPVLDDRSERYASMERYSGAVWSKKSNDYMWKSYLRDGFCDLEPYIAPMRSGNFAGLPPAYIEPQGIDVLRDEGIAYGEKFRQAEVPVELNVVEGSYHGFDSDIENPFVRQILARRVRAMAAMLEHNKNKERMP